MVLALAILLALPAETPIQVPQDPGLYYLSAQGLVRIEGRAVSIAHSRTKMPLSSKLPMTGGNETRAEIIGAHAEQRVTPTPVFYYRVTGGQESTGAGDLALVKLKSRTHYREFMISAEPEWKESSGIPLKSQVEFNIKRLGEGVFRLEPADDLDPGEYGFYEFRNHDLPGFLYCFSVPGDAN